MHDVKFWNIGKGNTDIDERHEGIAISFQKDV
jgi:hypothetical protein